MRTILEYHRQEIDLHTRHPRAGLALILASLVVFSGQAYGDPGPTPDETPDAANDAASDAASPGEPAAAKARPALPSAALWSGRSSQDVVVMNVVGDIAYPNDWGGIEEIDRRQHELFEQVQPILDSADLNFANIECPLTDTPASVDKEFPIACQQKRLAYMTDAGFNVFSLANNHSTDAGATGIQDTRDLLQRESREDRPLWWSGTGADADEARKPAIIQPPGKKTRIALFSVANSSYKGRVASLHDPSLPERVGAASQETDLVMVSVHYGPEYVHVPYKNTVDRYHALIDAGADVVIAHHPHVVQGVERYKNGFIFYSLGNFSFGSRTRRHLVNGARLYSMIGRMTFHRGALVRVEMIPLYANNGFRWTLGEETLDQRHATPQLLSGAFAQAALDEFEAFTRDVPGAQETHLHRVGDRLFAALGHGEMSGDERAQSVHQQIHEYMAVILKDARPRPATDAEQRVSGRGGTPDAAVRAAQAKAERDKKRKRGSKGKKRRAKKKKRKGKK